MTLNLKVDRPTDGLSFHNTLSFLDYFKASLSVLEKRLDMATVQGETPAARHVKKVLLNEVENVTVKVGVELEISQDEEDERVFNGEYG